MAIRLHFWGAAQTVTGSSHHLECAGQNVLLDCGLFQGHRQQAREINEHLALPAEQVNAVVLSHAHIDHSGNLPLLVKQGYRGPIYTTPSTVDLCEKMLKDSAHIQESDAEFVNRRAHRRRSIGVAPDGEAVAPLYTQADAEQAVQQFKPVTMHTPQMLAGSTADAGFTTTTFGAGHMLGSTCVLVEAPAPAAEYLIMESTYGNRLHQPVGPVKKKLANLVNRTAQRGGHIVMPAFAVGRTQQVVVLLHELIDEKAIPDIPIFVDSPLAVNVTDVFRKHEEEWDEGARAFADLHEDPFGWKRLRYIRTVEESKTLNGLHMPFIVIAASGMCEAGGVLHHLKNSVEDPKNLVLITGFQAENTLGRAIVRRQPEVKIFGEPMRLRAEVDSIGELSGHADQRELLAWMEPVVPTLKKVFLVHGELAAQQALKVEIETMYQLEVVCPKRDERYEVG